MYRRLVFAAKICKVLLYEQELLNTCKCLKFHVQTILPRNKEWPPDYQIVYE